METSLVPVARASNTPRAGARGVLACSLMAGFAVALGCASAGGGPAARQARCGLRAGDSVYAATGPVFRDCAVDRKAGPMSTNSRIDFQPPRGASLCYSADVEFVVDTVGAPEMRTAHVVRATDASFGRAVLESVANWRYQPAERDGHRVRQIVTDRRMAQTGVVVVPAGSAMPSRPPQNAPRPNC